MRDAEYGRVRHRLVLVEGRFHLDAVDVLAAPDDHVLGPVDDVHEALVVDAGDVPRVQPPVGERRRGFLGLVPVALDHVGSVDPQLADLTGAQRAALLVDDLHLAHRHRRPDAVRLAHVVVAAVHRGDRRRLGQPVAV